MKLHQWYKQYNNNYRNASVHWNTQATGDSVTWPKCRWGSSEESRITLRQLLTRYRQTVTTTQTCKCPIVNVHYLGHEAKTVESFNSAVTNTTSLGRMSLKLRILCRVVRKTFSLIRSPSTASFKSQLKTHLVTTVWNLVNNCGFQLACNQYCDISNQTSGQSNFT